MRRALLAAAAALAIALFSVQPASAMPSPAGLWAGPSVTAVTAPVVRTAFGDRTMTLDWSAVPGAKSYTVEYSTSSTFAKATLVARGTTSQAIIKNLRNGTRYYARLLVVPTSGSTVKSKSVSVVPQAGYPRALTVTVKAAGENQIRVSWTGQGRATKVAVIAGSEGSVTKHAFQSAWLPATSTSVVLTVPSSLRGHLGTGSGNPIFVKVATYNNMSAGTSFPRVKNEGAGYRLSLAGNYMWPGAVTPTGTKVRVGTWNVNSVSASAKYSGYTWLQRRTRVAAGIAASGAAVVAVQEATTADAGNGKRQWEDLRNLLKDPKYGAYSIATPDVGPAGTNATKGAHLFYQASVATLVQSGLVSAKSITSSWPSGLTDRYFAWAKLRHNVTGKEFVVASVHLPAGDSTALNDLRVREAKAIDAFLVAKAGGKPIVVLGDLNSSFAQSPNGPQKAFFDRGYRDAASSLKLQNHRNSTANITNQIDNRAVPGYPYTPYKYKYAAPRIDYVLVKNGGGSWAYVNRLMVDGNGKFVRTYQGSDHNMQAADISIR
jgi:endonuclease/exonuclease/phosphatase family metal-dependent hydrolase